MQQENMTVEQLREEILKHVEMSRMIADSLELAGQRVAATHTRSSIPFLESIAARISSMAAVPEGWRLVPVEMTDAMWAAAKRSDGSLEGAYRASVAAAPERPNA